MFLTIACQHQTASDCSHRNQIGIFNNDLVTVGWNKVFNPILTLRHLELIGTSSPIHQIVTSTPTEDIVAFTTDQRISTTAPKQFISRIVSHNPVSAIIPFSGQPRKSSKHQMISGIYIR